MLGSVKEHCCLFWQTSNYQIISILVCCNLVSAPTCMNKKNQKKKFFKFVFAAECLIRRNPISGNLRDENILLVLQKCASGCNMKTEQKNAFFTLFVIAQQNNLQIFLFIIFSLLKQCFLLKLLLLDYVLDLFLPPNLRFFGRS